MNDPDRMQRFALGPNGGPSAAALDEQERPAFLRHYGRILWRWRLVLAGCIIGFMLLGLVITLLMTPQYTATTTIEISRESDQIVNIQGVQRDASDSDQEFYQTQYGLLMARSLADRTVSELKLSSNRQFFEMFGAEDSVELLAGSSARTVAVQKELSQTAAEILLDNVDITPTRQSRLVEISFSSPDAQFSQRVSNAWANNFIRETLERRYEATSYARNFLESRLGQLRERLDESERQLMNYAQQQKIITLPGQGPQGSEQSTVAYDLVTLNSALSRATAARVAAEARYRSAAGAGGNTAEGLDNNALNVLRARRAEVAADYQKLLAQFQPDYPPVEALQRQLQQIDRSISREEQRIDDTILGAYRSAQAEETELQRRVEDLKASFLDQRRRSIRYTIFQREVDTNRQLYDALLQRYKEIGVAGGVGINNISIVDAAIVPEVPSSPKLILNLLLALFCGAAIGTGIAFLLEQSDEAITDPDEVPNLLGVPILGSVPKLQDGTPEAALLDRKSDMVDAYLAVQTNLQLSGENGVPNTVAVTSTRPSEGKSTTAFALATMLARANNRVVLIDGDMRSPSVHHLLGVGHARGLSNYLAGEQDLNELLLPVTEFGFHAMTAGPIPPNAAELLTSNRMAEMLKELLLQFDHVIIDSPPVMGLADAPLIGSTVDGVIYAVEANGVRSSLVRSAIARLSNANVRIIGAILTKFEPKKARSGYGYEYGYDYGRTGKGTSVQDG